MINEIAVWCLTSCPAYVRRMGYLYQCIALKRRYLRHVTSWQEHLEHTRSFILKTAAECKTQNRVIVLGSGLLLDVPLDELAAIFREVVLVDIVHLAEVKRRVRKYAHVKLVQAEITGVAERLYNNIKEDLYELSESMPVIPGIVENTSLVISLNILSQLAVVPINYLLQKGPARGDRDLDAWCDRIRSSHVALIGSLKCAVCLITDYKFICRDKGGNAVTQGSTVGKLTFPDPHQVWTWHIAPYGEEGSNHSKELIVGAWNTNKTL